MKKNYSRNNENRLHLIVSDDITIFDKKRIKKVRKGQSDKEDVRYNNSFKH